MAKICTSKGDAVFGCVTEDSEGLPGQSEKVDQATKSRRVLVKISY